jgi:Leucine-rich repeat (LRR) protein
LQPPLTRLGRRATIEYLKRMLHAQRCDSCVLDSFSLSRIPPEVIVSSSDYHGLVNLVSLDMRDNRLVMVTRGVEKLLRLTYLNLSYNDLETLPAELQELSLLTTLDVSHNALQAFPPGIGLMSQLVTWEFDGNPKLRLPKNLLRRPEATAEDSFEVRSCAVQHRAS